MSARSLPAGTRGFDCNVPVTTEQARAFMGLGYRFAVRYVPRVVRHAADLSAMEVLTLHRAGLAVMPVQHVESESSWLPTDNKGRNYGTAAGVAALAAGIGKGTTLWLDLEGVTPGTNSEQIIRFCNYWHDRVMFAGYQPGIYVGWHNGLTPAQLHQRLKFRRYWAAYNLNRDEYPLVRGVCLRQGVAKPSDKPSGIPFEFDTDVAFQDNLGESATVFAPDEWAV